MSALNEGIKALQTQLQAGTGIRTVTDPALVIAPCILIDLPSITARTMGAITMTVPVFLIAEGPGDQIAGEWLLHHLPDLLQAAQVSEASPRPVTIGDVTYPAMTITTTITITKE